MPDQFIMTVSIYFIPPNTQETVKHFDVAGIELGRASTIRGRSIHYSNALSWDH